MDDARIASIDIGDLAEVAAITLTTGGHEGKIYRLTGPEALTMTEVAERLSAATGRAVRYINVRPEEHRSANLTRGMPPYLADALVELYAERRNGKEGTVYADTAELLGRQPVSFGEFAERNAAIFRGEHAPAARI